MKDTFIVGSFEFIGTTLEHVEQILYEQYKDAVKAGDLDYEQKMKIALLDWCGEKDWKSVVYRLNL